MYRDMNNVRIFHGNAHRDLVEEVCARLNLPIGRADVGRFPDGETKIRFNENIRNRDVFIIQPTCPPVNDNLMELLLMVDAAKRASASSITAVIPYFGYARQDRKFGVRTPISAKLVSDLIATAGAERILSVDLHAEQIQGFFNLPVDNLFGLKVLQDYLRHNLFEPGRMGITPDELALITPDVGGARRVRRMAGALGCEIAICDRLEQKDQDSALKVVGDVTDQFCVIVDDIINTGSTICDAACELERQGARHIWACCSHATINEETLMRIDDSPIEKFIVLDTVPIHEDVRSNSKFVIVSVAWLLAEAIERLVSNQSVSALFR